MLCLACSLACEWAQGELEEMFAETICRAERYGGYEMARDGGGRVRLKGAGITPPKAGLLPLEEAGEGEGGTTAMLLPALARNVAKRMAARCENVANKGAVLATPLFMWKRSISIRLAL